MLRWVKRIALGALALVILVLGAGVVYEQWSRWSTARAFPPVGELLDVDGSPLHVHCTGAGTPTVILEAGLDAGGSQGWVTVQPEIAGMTRVCSYDRAGILWSERRDAPRDANRIADELHTLLGAASESPPYVMVGHSLGGPLVRVFADRFEGKVVGMVLVDSSHPEQVERFPPEAAEAMAPPPAVLLKSLAATGVLRLRPFPPPDGLPEPARAVIEAFLPRSILGLLGEVDALESISEQAGETGNLGDLPLVVLTAGRPPEQLPPGVSEETGRKIQDTWLVLQSELAALSTNADQRIIQDATHYIQLDDPEAVITAIQDVVTAVRESTPVRRIDG